MRIIPAVFRGAVHAALRHLQCLGRLWLAGLVLYGIASAAPISLTDSHGKLYFAAAPQRVVVLNWALAEQMLALGVQPVGMADIKGYQQQSAQMTVPAEVVEVGDRLAPNLRTIRELKPDVIVIGYAQRPLSRVLSNIAPIVYLNNFSRRGDNAQRAQQHLRLLGQLFDQAQQAQTVIAQQQRNLNQLKQALDAAYAQRSRPTLALVSIDQQYHPWVFTTNSLADAALQALGFRSAIEQPPSRLGAMALSVNQLRTHAQCWLLIPSAQVDVTLHQRWLRQQGGQCVLPLPAVPLYGGVRSIELLAQAITSVLLEYAAGGGA